MRYWNSLTDKYEDDGKQEGSIPLIDLDSYQRELRRKQSNFNDLQASGLLDALPDYTGTSNVFPPAPLSMPTDPRQPAATNSSSSKEETSSPAIPPKELSSQMNPEVKKYLADKYGLMNPEEYDKQLKAAQADAESRKDGMGWAQFAAGIGDAIAGRNPNESAKNFQNIRDNIDKDTVGALENRRKAQMDVLQSNRTLQSMQKEDDEQNPNSTKSVAFRKMIESQFPNVAKAYGKDWTLVAAADQENIFKPLQLKEQMDMRREIAQDRRDAKAMQQKAASTAQSKQRSNYEMGVLAENQYRSATDGKGYDPTSSGQLIDNDTTGWVPNALKDNKAIEAQAAENNWIETFLRDASGAAISEKERKSYQEIYFPTPGDSPTVVANKQRLREEKMNQARLSAGMGEKSLNETHTEDAQAVKWARANPKDPRAQRILKMHGMSPNGER